MKVKTKDLQGIALDWAVAVVFNPAPEWGEWKPSTNWAQGGPIIEREGIDLQCQNTDSWAADLGLESSLYGSTPLIAAMRCYVASKLGDEIELPEGLTK
jgi:hypothetical protein